MGHPVRRIGHRALRRSLRRATRPFRLRRVPRGIDGLFYVVGVVTVAMLQVFVILGIGMLRLGVWGVATVRSARGASTRFAPVQVRALTDFQRMTPSQFEQALAALCRRDGCTSVRVVGGAGDLGADVLATTPDGRRLVIQAKRYAPTHRVGSPEVQRVGGTYQVVHRAHLAAVVTTSGFTRAAVDYAHQADIALFGARELASWASHTGPGPWVRGRP
ncbi:restriction endonuclease [Streptacidiphilus anmyonensis]|uniref:restriction endonuclease n=1 Tax=Streptacidiphilus anmyonensis TaxID=405782 RepID=UPI000694C25A|nr:restriction endonuclease [Streptacidiphilus anmyonensis]